MNIFAPVKQNDLRPDYTEQPNSRPLRSYIHAYKDCQCMYDYLISQEVGTTNEVDLNLYDDTSQYLHKTVLYFCKRTVLKVLCYQNI